MTVLRIRTPHHWRLLKDFFPKLAKFLMLSLSLG